MKKFVSFTFTALLFFSFAISGFSANLKMGYVDTVEVFNEYQRTKDQDELLESKKEEVQRILEEKERRLRDIQNRLEVLREDQREAERDNLQEAMEDYRQARQRELSGIQRKRDEMMREIAEDIYQVIETYAKQNNYDLIINRNSILYAPEDKDLTETILNIINREYRR